MEWSEEETKYEACLNEVWPRRQSPTVDYFGTEQSDNFLKINNVICDIDTMSSLSDHLSHTLAGNHAGICEL